MAMSEPAFLEAMRDPNPWSMPRPVPDRYQTDRLLIRRFVATDAEALFKAVEVDRPALVQWLPWARTENMSVEACRQSIERFAGELQTSELSRINIVMGIFDRSTGKLLGGTGFHDIHRYLHDAEIGYWVRPDCQRQGICTEAVRGLISWGFTPQTERGWGFRRIVIFCAQANVASWRVVERIGLRLEVCARRKRYLEPIGYHDELGYGVLCDEWDRLNDQLLPEIEPGLQS